MSAPTTAAMTIELGELLSFPVRELKGLPVAVRIDLQVSGIHHAIVWTSELLDAPAEGLVFDGDEVRAIAIGVETERLWPADLKGFCLRKLHDPSFRVTQGAALDGAQQSVGPAWALERVLRWLELEVIAGGWAAAADAVTEPRPIGAAA